MAFNSIKVKTSNSGESINVSKLENGQSIRLRLVGSVQPAYRHWIPTRDGKSKPVVAAGFNPETQEWDKEDPLYDIPDSKIKRTESFYTINAIDRANPGKMKVLELKSTVIKALQALENSPDYGDCTDPVTGYDITITKEKTGPNPQNVKYTVLAARKSSPLTEEEKALQLNDLTVYTKVRPDYVSYIKEISPILDFQEDDYGSGSSIDDDDIPF